MMAKTLCRERFKYLPEEHLDHFLRQACGWGDSSVVKVLALPRELTRKKPDMVPLLVIPALRKPTGRSLGLSSQPMRVPMRDPVSKYTVAGGLGATPEVVLWTPRVWTLTQRSILRSHNVPDTSAILSGVCG